MIIRVKKEKKYVALIVQVFPMKMLRDFKLNPDHQTSTIQERLAFTLEAL